MDRRSGLHAHRDNGKRLVVQADEKLTAFFELESAIRALRRIAFAIRRDFLQNYLDELSGFLTTRRRLAAKSPRRFS
jgi:hypothetical protein